MRATELLSFHGFEMEREHAASARLKQLLAIARDEGYASALTYVADDNVPSPRGCAAIGFVPDHAHVSVRRLPRRRTDRLAVDDAMWAGWWAATGR